MDTNTSLSEFTHLTVDEKREFYLSLYKKLKVIFGSRIPDNMPLTRKNWEEYIAIETSKNAEVFVPSASRVVTYFSEKGKQNGWSVFTQEAEASLYNNILEPHTRQTDIAYDSLKQRVKDKIDNNYAKYLEPLLKWFEICKKQLGDVPTYKQWNTISYEQNGSKEVYPITDSLPVMPNAGQVTNLFYRWSIFIDKITNPEEVPVQMDFKDQYDQGLAPIAQLFDKVRSVLPRSVINIYKEPELQLVIDWLSSPDVQSSIKAVIGLSSNKEIFLNFQKGLDSINSENLQNCLLLAKEAHDAHYADIEIRAKARRVIINLTLFISIVEVLPIIHEHDIKPKANVSLSDFIH